MTDGKDGFEAQYSEKGFWEKVVQYAKTAGKEVIERALWLYFASQKPETPAWAKTVIYGALGYFIFPLDAIPDVVPFVGFADDLGALAVAVGTVAVHIDDGVKAKSAQKLASWFGV